MDSYDINGRWYRWSRYIMREGVVLPDTASDLIEYDPWASYRAHQGRYRTVTQPYVALLELSRRLRQFEEKGIFVTKAYAADPPDYRPRAVTVFGPPTEADDYLLNWCNQNGLLGILPTISDHIKLSPQVTPAGPLETVVELRWYERTGGEWHTRSSPRRCIGKTESEVQREVERRLKEAGPPGVFTINLYSLRYEIHHPSRSFIANFTAESASPDAIAVPLPGTSQFRTAYRETTEEILRYAHLFEKSVATLCAQEDYFNPEFASGILNSLAIAAAPSFKFSPSRQELEEVRFSPGLLASYALMFLWDRVSGRRVLKCENCTQYFVSDERKARYCTPKCRNTAQARRSRQMRGSRHVVRKVT
jgi:hypothetical protein